MTQKQRQRRIDPTLDHYSFLGIPEDSSEDAILESISRITQILDEGDTTDLEAKKRRLEAAQVLIDQDTRQEYLSRRKEWLLPPNQGALPLVQVISDIHLEDPRSGSTLPFIPVKGVVLALLGDIGYPCTDAFEEFLLLQADRFRHVILVPGNHEYYITFTPPLCYEDILKRMQEICSKRDNLHFLQRTTLELQEFPSVRFIGTTLWSQIPEKFKEKMGWMVNDYNFIYTRLNPDEIEKETLTNQIQPRTSPPLTFTVDHTNALNSAECQFIRQELLKCKQDAKKAVVLTHHAPTRNMTIPFDEEEEPICYMNFTPLEDLFAPPLVAWAFGHTHKTSRQICSGVQIVSNQLGYVKEHDQEFQPDFCFDPLEEPSALSMGIDAFLKWLGGGLGLSSQK